VMVGGEGVRFMHRPCMSLHVSGKQRPDAEAHEYSWEDDEHLLRALCYGVASYRRRAHLFLQAPAVGRYLPAGFRRFSAGRRAGF